MSSQTVVSKNVNLTAYGNEVITRVVVAVEKGVYFVCKREEYEAAMSEGREPVCIGFRREYVVGLEREN
jgi:hypothetical protein